MVYKSILFYFPSSYLWQTHVLLLKILFNSNVFPLQYNLGEKKKSLFTLLKRHLVCFIVSSTWEKNITIE